MGITIVQKSDLSKKKLHAKTALVLAGGAVSGGAFKVGGLKALNDFLLNRKVTDFDIYVGISAGAFLAAPLAGGVHPEEILKSIDGNSHRFTQVSPFELYYPNYREFIERPLRYFYDRATYFPNLLIDFVTALPNVSAKVKDGIVSFFKAPSYSNYEKMLKPLIKSVYSRRGGNSFVSLLPSGIFDNNSLEKFLRENMKRNKMSNHFKVLKRMRGKDLYISATDLDTAENVVFGWDEKNDVSISEAVMASTAMPGFYKPSRIKGVDYIDGGVRETANIDLAVAKGADLIVCYNPFRPIKNNIELEFLREDGRYVTRDRRIADNGMFGVFNQVFRCLYHSRLSYVMERYQQDPNFKGDIILIEPEEDDSYFFEMNPFAFWTRDKAAKLGFESVSRSINGRFEEIRAVLNSYGIEMTRDMVASDEAKMRGALSDDKTIMDVLENDSLKGRKLKLVAS